MRAGLAVGSGAAPPNAAPERVSPSRFTLGRMQAQAAIERSLWLERVDAAEIRAERVEQRLDQVLDVLLSERRQPAGQAEPGGEREPWWRRWFGVSTRSDIGWRHRGRRARPTGERVLRGE